MACTGCGGAAARARANADVVPGYTATVGPNGVYQLGSYLGCTEPYSGTRQRDDVFVVGLGTEGERLYTIAERDTMLAYSKSARLRLTRLTAHTLCHDAMVELFGS